MQVVPSLQVSTQTAGDGGGSATFFLRGMGQQRSASGSEPAVGIYVDDFYYPSLAGTLFDVVDLASLEVLRGPQGTLFGRNTIGGAIRYNTRRAEVGSFSGHFTGTIGNRNQYNGSGSVNIPIGDRFGLRLTGGHLEQGGFVRVQTGGKDAGGTKTDIGRVQLRIEPMDGLYADLSVQYSKFDIDGFTYNVPGPLTPRPPLPGASPTLPFVWNTRIAPARQFPLYTDAFASSCYYCQYGTLDREFSATTYRSAFSTIGWDITKNVTLKSLTSWQSVYTRFSNDLDSTPLPIFNGGIVRNQTYALSQELQLNGKSADNKVTYVGGAFYYNERVPGLAPERQNFVLGTLTPISNLSNRKLKSYAAFFDGSLKLDDQWTLLGGFRESVDNKSVLVSAFPTGIKITSADARFTSATFRAGAQYAFTRDFMAYGNLSTGFRGGGFNPYDARLTPSIRPFSPEKSTSYEAGLRMQFLDRRITLNPTVFFVDWDKIQVQQVAPDNTGNVIPVLQNAGAARSSGFELEWSAAVNEQVRLFGNFAYLNLHYKDVGQATGITLQSDLQRAPRISYAFGAAHTAKLDATGTVVSTLNYSYQDRQRSTPTDSDTLILPSYALLNGRVQFDNADKSFSVAAFVNNMLDKKYAVGGVNFYSNVGAARYDLGRPRTFGITARINF